MMKADHHHHHHQPLLRRENMHICTSLHFLHTRHSPVFVYINTELSLSTHTHISWETSHVTWMWSHGPDGSIAIMKTIRANMLMLKGLCLRETVKFTFVCLRLLAVTVTASRASCL